MLRSHPLCGHSLHCQNLYLFQLAVCGLCSLLLTQHSLASAAHLFCCDAARVITPVIRGQHFSLAVWGVVLNKLLPVTVTQTWGQSHETIVCEIRFPRALLAMMVGARPALIDASLEAVTRDPMADLHLMGISSDEAFGAILILPHSGLFLGL